MKKERIVSRYEIDVPQKTRRKGRKTKVVLRFGAVEIIRPGTSRKTCDVPKIKLMAVFVEETNPPRGEEPVRWMLLTTCAVRNAKDAKRIIKFYRMRWAIEELNRTMKRQGMNVEESQITRANPMKKLCVMALIAATRTIQLVRARDGLTRQKFTDGFDKKDQAVLVAANKKMEGKTDKQKNPHRRASLAWASWIIGRLGGWTGYYKPPGPKIMNIGLKRFDDIKVGWLLANGSKNV